MSLLYLCGYDLVNYLKEIICCANQYKLLIIKMMTVPDEFQRVFHVSEAGVSRKATKKGGGGERSVLGFSLVPHGE